MPSRTFHHKSRHGCLNCKQRRKRCDQKIPTCSRCVRQRITCRYDQLLYPTAAGTGSLVRPLATEWATIEPSIQAVLSLRIPHVDFSDVEMIYHFNTRQSTTLDTMPGISGVRRLNLVTRAPEYPYLLYGLIAASALHTRYGTESEYPPNHSRLEEKATNFYQLALSTYRSRLDVIDEKTCHSIFAFSVILAALTFGLLHPTTTDNHHNAQKYIGSVISIFDLLLGAVAIADESRAWIPNLLAAEPLLLPIRASLSRHYNPITSEAHDFLDFLQLEISATHALSSRSLQDVPIDISIIYESAIPELRNVFFCLQKPEPNNILGIIGWPAFVGRPFASLLKQHQPAALVVLACYGVALQALDHIWWLRGVGSRLIQSVAEAIRTQYGEEWQRLLQWPLAKVARPELNEAANQGGPTNSSLCPGRKGSSTESARPFEFGLVITQFKGITGPYRTAASSHDQRSV